MKTTQRIPFKLALFISAWIIMIYFIPTKTHEGSGHAPVPSQAAFSRLTASPNLEATKAKLSNRSQKGFTENKGQLRQDQETLYYLKDKGVNLSIQKDGLAYVWVKSERSANGTLGERSAYVYEKLALSWIGANPAVEIIEEDPLPAFRNFFTELRPGGIKGVRSYRKLVFQEIYPHIDWVLYLNDDQLKYDFVVRPGGKVSDIRFRYQGQDQVELLEEGELKISNNLGALIEGKPFTYQNPLGDTLLIASKYELTGDTLGFYVEAYDSSKTLVIDPTLIWSTYFGAEEVDKGNAICTDPSGNIYIAGESGGDLVFPSDDVHDIDYGGGSNDAFLAKYDPTGNLLWATYYGGQDDDAAQAVCLSSFGGVYIGGWTHSNSGIAYGEGYYAPHDDTYNESNNLDGNRFDRDAFLARFRPDDGSIVFGTYYGGEDGRTDEGTSICAGPDGVIYLAGYTGSSQHIAYEGFQNTYSNKADAFLVKFNGGNGERIWATYYGEEETDIANAVATDDWGNVYITGYTESTGMAYKGHDLSYSEDKDAFLVKFSEKGERYWATYYGDTGIDQAHSIAIYQGYVYIAGITSSANFIAKHAHDKTYNGGVDAFLAQFGVFGHFLWGTYYGGSEDEGILGNDGTSDPPYIRSNHVSVSSNGEVYLSGITKSSNGIATASGYDTQLNDGIIVNRQDGFLVRFLDNGNRQWGTYFGGKSNDYVSGSSVDPWGSVYITGYTTSNADIAFNGYDNSYNSGGDAFLAKFDPYGEGPNGGPGDVKDPENPNEWPTHGRGSQPGRLGLSSSSSHSSLSVYPNPAKGIVNIPPLGRTEGRYHIQVFDLLGNQVFSKESLNSSQPQPLNLQNLPAGSYMVRISGFGETYSQKLLLQ